MIQQVDYQLTKIMALQIPICASGVNRDVQAVISHLCTAVVLVVVLCLCFIVIVQQFEQ